MKMIHHLLLNSGHVMIMMVARILAILKTRIKGKYFPTLLRTVCDDDNDMHYLLTVGISNSISSLAGIFTYKTKYDYKYARITSHP